MPVVDASRIQTEKRLTELVAITSRLNFQVQTLVLDAVRGRLDDSQLRIRVAQVQGVVKATDADIRMWLVSTVPVEYLDGLNIANKKLKLAQATLDQFQKSKDFLLHRQAVNVLLKDSYLDFGNTMVGVVRGAERILNDALRQQIRQGMAVGEITGSSARQIAEGIKNTFQESGFSILLNRAGRKWTLTDYSEMLARTQLIKSANDGLVNRLRETNKDIVEWSSAPDERECDVCDSLDGKVFSLSGDSAEYPQLEQSPPRHPNCRCSLIPRPDLESD